MATYNVMKNVKERFTTASSIVSEQDKLFYGGRYLSKGQKKVMCLILQKDISTKQQIVSTIVTLYGMTYTQSPFTFEMIFFRYGQDKHEDPDQDLNKVQHDTSNF